MDKKQETAEAHSKVKLKRKRGANQRVLIVTPEITYLPEGMGNLSQRMRAKAGGLADVSASLVSALYDLRADVHVALPNYRRMFQRDVQSVADKQLKEVRRKLPGKRIHLAEDRIFYHREEVYSADENVRIALAFQREVINHIIPRVKPKLIHCNDWMTGLIPAVARRLGIPCLFTVHNIHTEKLTLEQIEDRGIDAAEFWQHLYFERPPYSYEETRSTNPADLLASGIFAAHYVNTVSPTFLNEVVHGYHHFVPPAIRWELGAKLGANCATGVLNAPDPTFDPARDPCLARTYGPDDHANGKRANKAAFQERMGLTQDPSAPILFWPSRLDPLQKGCQLVTDILFQILSDYDSRGLQVAVVANGAFQRHFRDIANCHKIHHRLAVHDFDERLSHLGYGAADFLLMPSRFEPCGLPQMVGAIHGVLSVVHDTGGLHDTITPLDIEANRGNGFPFTVYDTQGLRWGIDQALLFHARPEEERARQIRRIMIEAKQEFSHETAASRYIDLYETMLERPLTPDRAE